MNADSVKVVHRPGGNPDEQFDFSVLLQPLSVHEMAIQAGAARFYPAQQSTKDDAYIVGLQFLERFAQAARRQALEDAAKVCEQADMESFGVLPVRAAMMTSRQADAIRALKEAP